LKQFLAQSSSNQFPVETVSDSIQFKSVLVLKSFQFNPVQISFGLKEFLIQSLLNHLPVETVSGSIQFLVEAASVSI
jgi:hypothetical protein